MHHISLFAIVALISTASAQLNPLTTTGALPDDTEFTIKFCDEKYLQGYCDLVTFTIRGCWAIPSVDEGDATLSFQAGL